MARIRTYQLDENITTSDYLLGNDGDNGSVITKRFSIEDLKEFINEDIPLAQQLPPGYISATDQQGDSFERSPIQVQHTESAGPHVFLDGMSVAGFDIFYLTLSNGQQVFRFENYNEPFYLPSFVGKSFTFKVVGDTVNTYTGTFQSYQGFLLEDTATSGTPNGDFDDYVDVFYIEVTGRTDGESVTIATTQLQNFTVDNSLTRVKVEVGADFGIKGAAELDGDLTVGGDTTLDGDLTVNGDSVNINTDVDISGDVEIGTNTDRSEVHVHGTLHFDDPNEGIVFGPTGTGNPADMTTTTFTVDEDGNLTINGAPDNDLPNFTFGDNVCVNVDKSMNTTGIVNDGVLTQNGDTTVNGDLTINGLDEDGDPDGSSVTISDGTITTVTSDGSVGPSLVQIFANNQTNVTEDVTAQLSSLTIGSGVFTLPEFSSGVAEALPGLTEDLEGSPIAFSTGRFFIGNEQSTGALYQGSSTEDIAGISQTIAAGVTSHDLDTQTFTATAGQTSFALNRIPEPFVSVTVDGTDLTSDFTNANPSIYSGTALTAGQIVVFNYDTADSVAFEALRALIDSDNREAIFFVESTSTFDFSAAVAGSTVIPSTEDVYEVIAYDSVTKVITFGKLGTGTINIDTEALDISSPEVTLSEIPQETFNADAPDFHQFVTIDSSNELSKSPLSFSGDFRGARYTDDDETDQGITGIDFTGNNCDGDAGVVTVDTNPKYADPILIDETPATAVSSFDTVILRPCAAASFFTLPLASVGDSVKVVNTSTIDPSDPFNPATTEQWSIFPNATQAIMGISNATVLPMGETRQLELDDAVASFELLYSGDDALGWVIVGIN